MTDAILDMMEEDAQEAPVIDDNAIIRISDLIKKQQACERHVAELEEELKEATAELRDVSERQLPDAMQEAGTSEFTTDDGLKVTIKDEVYATISQANRFKAFAWLREHGFDDIIKNEFKIPFGRGEDSEAETLEQFLRENGFDGWSNKESVHAGTLKAFIREQLKEGNDVPLELFSAYEFRKAKISQQ